MQYHTFIIQELQEQDGGQSQENSPESDQLVKS